MSGFDKSAQFSDGNQCYVSAFAPMNDDRFPRIDRFIEQRLQVCSGLSVGRLGCHSDMYRIFQRRSSAVLARPIEHKLVRHCGYDTGRLTIFPSPEVRDSGTAEPRSLYALPETRSSAGKAWLLSLLLPGLGQIYVRAGIRGPATLGTFVLSVVVALFIPGEFRWLAARLAVMLYAFAPYDAYETARERNAGIEADASDNPRVAALLNITTNGFGYVYLGNKLGF